MWTACRLAFDLVLEKMLGSGAGMRCWISIPKFDMMNTFACPYRDFVMQWLNSVSNISSYTLYSPSAILLLAAFLFFEINNTQIASAITIKTYWLIIILFYLRQISFQLLCLSNVFESSTTNLPIFCSTSLRQYLPLKVSLIAFQLCYHVLSAMLAVYVLSATIADEKMIDNLSLRYELRKLLIVIRRFLYLFDHLSSQFIMIGHKKKQIQDLKSRYIILSYLPWC